MDNVIHITAQGGYLKDTETFYPSMDNVVRKNINTKSQKERR